MTTVKLSFLLAFAAEPCPPNPPPAVVVLLLDFERLNISCLPLSSSSSSKQQIGKEGSFVQKEYNV